MGLHSIYSTYEGVSPEYLRQVILKITIAIVLLLFFYKITKRIKKSWIIFTIIVIVIGVVSYTAIRYLSDDETPTAISKKATQVFGNDYCNENHLIMQEGEPDIWNCELCTNGGFGLDTNIPVICERCARITGRCEICGKLKNK